MQNDIDPIKQIAEARRTRIQQFYQETYNTKEFKDALQYILSLRNDYFIALKYISLMGWRFGASDKLLLIKHQDYLTEASTMAVEAALEGMHNSCMRELRYILEASVKFLSLDQNHSHLNLEKRGELLSSENLFFKDYVDGLKFFPEFSADKEIKDEIKSLYSELSLTIHPSVQKIKDTERRAEREDYVCMESISSLNKTAKILFKVLDISLLSLFHSLDLSSAGDIFTMELDDYKKWRFHKGRYVSELSKCFDYKAERISCRNKI